MESLSYRHLIYYDPEFKVRLGFVRCFVSVYYVSLMEKFIRNHHRFLLVPDEGV